VSIGISKNKTAQQLSQIPCDPEKKMTEQIRATHSCETYFTKLTNITDPFPKDESPQKT